MKYYVKILNGIDGPFKNRTAAEAHVRRCEYDVHGIEYEYITEVALAKELGIDDEEE